MADPPSPSELTRNRRGRRTIGGADRQSITAQLLAYSGTANHFASNEDHAAMFNDAFGQRHHPCTCDEPSPLLSAFRARVCV